MHWYCLSRVCPHRQLAAGVRDRVVNSLLAKKMLQQQCIYSLITHFPLNSERVKSMVSLWNLFSGQTSLACLSVLCISYALCCDVMCCAYANHLAETWQAHQRVHWMLSCQVNKCTGRCCCYRVTRFTGTIASSCGPPATMLKGEIRDFRVSKECTSHQFLHSLSLCLPQMRLKMEPGKHCICFSHASPRRWFVRLRCIISAIVSVSCSCLTSACVTTFELYHCWVKI